MLDGHKKSLVAIQVQPSPWGFLTIPVEGVGPVDLWITLIDLLVPLLPLPAMGQGNQAVSAVLAVLLFPWSEAP